ncbi:AMP-binding protein, partial [Lysobacter sp. 2RAB21]
MEGRGIPAPARAGRRQDAGDQFLRPSEATIDSTYFEGDAADLDASRMVPIGRAFPNSALYILDAQQQPVPAGVPGELWIGGGGVSAGYVGDDEQTAQRFRELP